MKMVPLTQGKFALVPDECYEELAKHKWYAAKIRGCYYAIRNTRTVRREQVRMHRAIWEMLNGPIQEGMQIDHINHDGLDNRVENIRLCTNQENCFNRRKQDYCSSRYKGVSWNKKLGRWMAYVAIDQRMQYLGLFDSEIKAATAYNQAARELFGDRACLNLPNSSQPSMN